MQLLKFTSFRHFLAIAEGGRVAGAARQLHITQPALSRSIHALEESAGGSLFDRTPQGMRLTALGETLAPAIRRIVAEADHAIAQCRELRSGGGVSIRAGVSESFNVDVVPEAIARFVEECPGAHVRVTTGIAEHLLPMLKARQLDLLLIVVPADIVAGYVSPREDIVCEIVGTVRVRVYAPPRHPATRGRPTLEQLQRERWGLPLGLSVNYWFRGRFHARGMDSPTQLFCSTSLDLLVRTCGQRGLLTLLPGHVVRSHVADGALTPVDAPELEIDQAVVLIRQRRCAPSAEVAAFAHALGTCCREFALEEPLRADRETTCRERPMARADGEEATT
jgi:DNA-binding transcriptional LysR family regulator